MIAIAKHGTARGVLGRCQLSIFRHASTLVVAEHDNVNLSPSSLSAVTAAGELKGGVTFLVLGHEAQAVAEQVMHSLINSNLLHQALKVCLGTIFCELKFKCCR